MDDAIVVLSPFVSSKEFNPTRLDQLFQYALAVASQAEDFKQRELGPIHLLKYAYLADLAFAERHDGASFSGVDWTFHHFGPWSVAAFSRVSPAALNVAAIQRSFGSRDANDAVRYRLDPTDAELLASQLERGLPSEITSAISRAVHEHGSDTADLLRHVYLTAPMLSAEPGATLNLKAICRETAATDWTQSEDPKLTVQEKRQRKSVLASARAEVQRRLQARAVTRVTASPAPRYDEVFFEGTAILDHEAGEPISATKGEVRFDQSVWHSPQRRDPEVS